MAAMIGFRLDAEEMTILAEEAAAQGMSLNAYARHLMRQAHKQQTMAQDVYVSGDEYLQPSPVNASVNHPKGIMSPGGNVMHTSQPDATQRMTRQTPLEPPAEEDDYLSPYAIPCGCCGVYRNDWRAACPNSACPGKAWIARHTGKPWTNRP